jgi:hypothetical protein
MGRTRGGRTETAEVAAHAGKEVLRFWDWVTGDQPPPPLGMGADGRISRGAGRAAMEDSPASEIDQAAVVGSGARVREGWRRSVLHDC